MIPLGLRGPAGWRKTSAYVDSGATYSIFRKEEADHLGLEMTRGQRRKVIVGDGKFITIFLHDVDLQIGPHRMRVPVGFSEELGVGFNLLGRYGVFQHFKVCFDDRERTVVSYRKDN